MIFFQINSDYETERLDIYSLEGILVKKKSFLSKDQAINVSDLTPGFYLVSIAIKDSIITRKIQIK